MVPEFPEMPIVLLGCWAAVELAAAGGLEVGGLCEELACTDVRVEEGEIPRVVRVSPATVLGDATVGGCDCDAPGLVVVVLL